MEKSKVFTISNTVRLECTVGDTWNLNQINKDQTLDEIILDENGLRKLRESINEILGKEATANENKEDKKSAWENPLDFLNQMVNAAGDMNIADKLKEMSEDFGKKFDETVKEALKTKYFVSYKGAYGVFGNLDIETEKPIKSSTELQDKLEEALKNSELQVVDPVMMFYREV